MKDITFSPVGDSAVSAIFGDAIAPNINKSIRRTLEAFNQKPVVGIIELVPTYAALLVQYDPLIYSYEGICQLILDYISQDDETSEGSTVRVVELPVVYGGEYGPDIAFVANHTGFSESEVIQIHSGTDYLVYMLGFIPGFTYLGGMDARLTTPRLTTPRTLILAGSVGIAGSQTGTYPSDSPGGWQIIGRTPLTLYDGDKENPTLLSAGDYVRYVPITSDEYLHIKENLHTYEPIIHMVREEDLRGQQ